MTAAQILLEHDQPVEAASRTYYAAYQMVTAVLVKLKLNPRSEYGNWSHHETRKMYLTHICHKADLNYKDRAALNHLRAGFWTLLSTRYKADYDLDKNIDLHHSRTLWRDANRLVRLLENLIQRGVL